jgi:hypothetical protein
LSFSCIDLWLFVMVAAGVIAGDNRDAFVWNKKKK